MDCNTFGWGVSVEDRKYGLPRLKELQNSDAAVKFLSIEPLLEDSGTIDLRGIDWVIVGGESGPGARPMQKEWALSIRDRCRDAGVPFFFKQWGGTRKKRAGRMLDGAFYDQFPQVSLSAEVSEEVRLTRIATLQEKGCAHLRPPVRPLAGQSHRSVRLQALP